MTKTVTTIEFQTISDVFSMEESMKGLIHRNLPLGMAVAGSFRSPDKFAPATIPVTAGKKTPKMEKKEGVSLPSSFAW
jgi:hypothetical protein